VGENAAPAGSVQVAVIRLPALMLAPEMALPRRPAKMVAPLRLTVNDVPSVPIEFVPARVTKPCQEALPNLGGRDVAVNQPFQEDFARAPRNFISSYRTPRTEAFDEKVGVHRWLTSGGEGI
jgi:hypothetical protein